MSIWRAFELMEVEAGNLKAAQSVYQRSIRDSMGSNLSESAIEYDDENKITEKIAPKEEILKRTSEVEVSRWNSRESFGESDVWINDGSIEGKVPSSVMKSKKPKKQQ